MNEFPLNPFGIYIHKFHNNHICKKCYDTCSNGMLTISTIYKGNRDQNIGSEQT